MSEPRTFPGSAAGWWLPLRRTRPAARPVAWLPGFDAAQTHLLRDLRAGDVCLIMGAGDVDTLGRALAG